MKSKLFGILAFPAKHSLSPIIHNSAYKADKLPYSYEIFERDEKEFDDFINFAKENLSGFSVSLPYKVRIMDKLDKIDEVALKIGAVNTVKVKNGKLYGFNTDCEGFKKALTDGAEALDFLDYSAVVLGAGGAGRAVVAGLIELGAKRIFVLNRGIARAALLASDFGERVSAHELNTQNFLENHAFELKGKKNLLIQTTSIWTLGGKNEADFSVDFLNKNFLSNFEVVMDISYKPLITPLLLEAKKLGLKAISGDKMLLFQAVEQYKIFTEKKIAPITEMEKALGDTLVMP